LKRAGLIISILLVAAFLAAFASAEGRDGPRSRFGPGSYAAPDLTEAPGLNLTLRQRERLVALRAGYLRDIRPTRDSLDDKSRELRKLWLETSPDWERIRIVQREVRLLWDRVREEETSYLRDAFGILTPEQRAVARDSEIGPRLRPGMGRDGQGGMGRGRGMMGR